ncbi:hypothetical protein AVEN_257990-1 [Araneus ventricosus]|uniref:Uncharacterized protein n=1 Tax=Araneus ventricosus TaxID=182803 RepID=A0A4Y2PZ08_ARAVE|nr:hypothetical protein AVEN_257990-1 [Araneus ventricosus]
MALSFRASRFLAIHPQLSNRVCPITDFRQPAALKAELRSNNIPRGRITTAGFLYFTFDTLPFPQLSWPSERRSSFIAARNLFTSPTIPFERLIASSLFSAVTVA